MTHLFVYTADADAEAVMRVVLKRSYPHLAHEVDRHDGRDAGMVKSGPETVRFKAKKDVVERVLLLWDHHGSGREKKASQHTETDILLRLEQWTWKDQSAAIAIVPELEEWIWHDPKAICSYYGLKPPDLQLIIGSEFPASPKDALTTVHHKSRQRRKLQARDFSEIAEAADFKLWRKSDSFNRLITILQTWFPSHTQWKGPHQ